MMKVIVSALTVSCAVYTTVGLFVYLTFGSNTNANFDKNFATDDPWLRIVRMAMTFAISAAFPISMVAARSSVLKILGWDLTPYTQVLVSSFLTFGCLSFALSSGELDKVLEFVGSLFGTPVAYILPMLMYCCMPRDYQKQSWRAFSISCVIIGACFAVLGLTIKAKQVMTEAMMKTK